jgi:hypothetical protein
MSKEAHNGLPCDGCCRCKGHKWKPGGTVRQSRESRSPYSTYDDLLWDDILQVQVCECGETRRVKVGEDRLRHRGDDIRRAAGKRPLGRLPGSNG